MPDCLFDVVLCREHCQPAAREDIERRGGNPWDTVKPLHRYFANLARVVLLDDSGATWRPLHAWWWQPLLTVV